MTITLRSQKGAPLSVEELDGNFEDLAKRLHQFENHAHDLESIGKITEKDGILRFRGSKGSNLGEVRIPPPKLQFKGSWKPSAPYYPNDLATHKGALLLCKSAHAAETFEAQNWTSVFEKVQADPPTLSSLPIYEKGNLPKPEIGKLAILIGGKGPLLLFGNGKTWKQLIAKEV